MIKCNFCDFETKSSKGLAIHKGKQHKKQKKYPKWLYQIAPLFPYAPLLILASVIVLSLLPFAQPLYLADVPKKMTIFMGFSREGDDYNLTGSLNLYNTGYGPPLSDFFIVGNTIVGRDINIIFSKKPEMKRANLKMYALPEEFSNKGCNKMTEEDEKSFGGVQLYNLFSRKLYYISPKEQVISPEYISTASIFKKGTWKILLCMEYFYTNNWDEVPRVIQIGIQTIDVITTYDLALFYHFICCRSSPDIYLGGANDTRFGGNEE